MENRQPINFLVTQQLQRLARRLENIRYEPPVVLVEAPVEGISGGNFGVSVRDVCELVARGIPEHLWSIWTGKWTDGVYRGCIIADVPMTSWHDSISDERYQLNWGHTRQASNLVPCQTAHCGGGRLHGPGDADQSPHDRELHLLIDVMSDAGILMRQYPVLCKLIWRSAPPTATTIHAALWWANAVGQLQLDRQLLSQSPPVWEAWSPKDAAASTGSGKEGASQERDGKSHHRYMRLPQFVAANIQALDVLARWTSEAPDLITGGELSIVGASGEVVKPHWDPEKRVLKFNGEEVRKWKRNAPNCFLVLKAFQEEGWPHRVLDPLPGGKDEQRIHSTCKSINSKMSGGLRISPGGDGESFIWESLS